MERHRSTDLAARSPFQTATDREAAQGTTRATPISVSSSTASSPRLPFGIAWTTVTTGSASGASTTDATVTSNARLAVEATSPVATRPRPSVSTTLSPTRSRRTATAWCASSPVTSTVEPTVASTSDGTQWTGSVISAR